MSAGQEADRVAVQGTHLQGAIFRADFNHEPTQRINVSSWRSTLTSKPASMPELSH